MHENASKWVWNFENILTLWALPEWDKNGLKKYFPIVEPMGLFLVVQYPIGELHAKFQLDGNFV